MQIKLGDSSAVGTENAVSVLGTDLEQLIRERYDGSKWNDIVCSQLIVINCYLHDIHDLFKNMHLLPGKTESEFS